MSNSITSPFSWQVYLLVLLEFYTCINKFILSDTCINKYLLYYLLNLTSKIWIKEKMKPYCNKIINVVLLSSITIFTISL